MLPLTRSRNRARFFGIPFSPSTLFEGGTVAGAWYDPSDLSTMFDSSAGTTPVAMPGLGAAVPVGLMLDKSQGLVLGSELVTNGDFSSGSTSWTLGSNWTVASGLATTSAANSVAPNRNLTQNAVFTVGKRYKISFTITSGQPRTGNTAILINSPSGTVIHTLTPTSTYPINVSAVFQATQTEFTLATSSADPQPFSIDNISVRELPGNHAIAFNNTTARPELMARVNLLEYSEQFDNGYWTKTNVTVTPNTAVAPDGATTADTLTENATSGSFLILNTPLTVVANTAITFSVCAKYSNNQWFRLLISDAATESILGWFDIQNGIKGNISSTAGATNPSSSITSLGDGWYRCSVTVTLAGTLRNAAINNVSGDGSNTRVNNGASFIWGADLRPANIGANVPAYQRIADALTYDTSGFPLYLFFTADDSMYTPANLNLSGTDKVSVFAGVRQTTAGSQQLVEFSADTNTNNGAFSMPKDAVAAAVWTIGLRGTSATSASSPANYAAPITTVNAGLYDIALSTDEAKLRINGAQVATSGAGSAGSGNFGTYPLYIGSRGNSSLWFNGHLHSLIIAGSAVSAGNISATEQWVAGKTGLVLP